MSEPVKAREWQDGDRAWKHDAMWRRLPYGGPMPWSSDHFGNRKRCSDFDMTAADAVLLATAAGPVPAGDVRQEWGYRFRGVVGAESVLHEERAMDEHYAREGYAQLLTRPDWYADVALLRRTVSTSPWVVVSDGE